MRTLLSLLTLLLLAAPAHAASLRGRVRVLGDAVTLERAEGAKLLLAGDGEGRKVLEQVAQFPGLLVVVDGRAEAAGFVVTGLVSPTRHEVDLVVGARPGHPGELVVRMGTSGGMVVVGPNAGLLTPLVNHEVRLRGWFFLDEYGALPDTCYPVAVKDTKVVGHAGRVSGTLRAGDDWTLTDAQGRVFAIAGGEGVLPRDLREFDGRDGVELEGAIVEEAGKAPTLLVERVLSPVEVRLTGRVVGGSLRAEGRVRTLIGREDHGLPALVASAEGKEVTVRGLATPGVLFVRGVAGRVTGTISPEERFRVPADGQVWIARSGEPWSVIVADGQPDFALIAPADVAITARPTKGLSGALGE